MTDLFSERDPARVAARLGDIERLADRRERFHEHLDFDALGIQTCREIERADDRLFEKILFVGL